jgi:hypothetical protein
MAKRQWSVAQQVFDHALQLDRYTYVYGHPFGENSLYK